MFMGLMRGATRIAAEGNRLVYSTFRSDFHLPCVSPSRSAPLHPRPRACSALSRVLAAAHLRLGH